MPIGRRLSVPNTVSTMSTIALCTKANKNPSDARVSQACAVSRTPATRESHQTVTWTNAKSPVGAVAITSSA